MMSLADVEAIRDGLTMARTFIREAQHADRRWAADVLTHVEEAIEVVEPGLLAKLKEEECGICGSDLDVHEGKCDDCRGVPEVTQ